MNNPRPTATCLNCGIKFKYAPNTHFGKYCSNSCQKKFESENKYITWLSGDGTVIKGARFLRRSVIRRDGYKCAECGIYDWNGKPLTLEVEHKNGNGNDNSPKNVCLKCPNCHSQTETFRAKNKGNGRHSRRERYALGKSY